MPYVRQRSILQRAPRFHLRGMGDVSPCDPNFSGPLTPDQQLACLPVWTVPTPSVTLPATAEGKIIGAVNPQSVTPLTDFLTTYKTPLMIGGGLFAGILLLKALR